MSGADDGDPLQSLFAAAAEAAGHSGLWRAYVAGRLGLPPTDLRLDALASSPAPRDRSDADALARRCGVDSRCLWWIVQDAAHTGISPRLR